MVDRDDTVCVGRFGKPHGIRGLIKLVSYCDVEEDIANYCPLLTRPGDHEITLMISHKSGNSLVARVEGIKTRKDAAGLKGMELFAARTSFPPAEDGEYYYVDLIGLEVQDMSGARLGQVKTVANFGATDLLIIEKSTGETVTIPFFDPFVPEVNLADGWVRIDDTLPSLPNMIGDPEDKHLI